MQSFKPRLVASSLLVLALLTPLPALAYIDPNTGGMIFQILAPILAMVTSAWLFLKDRIKAGWHRLKRAIFPSRQPATDSDSN
jgi:hypothetical protein